jgi:hypothetical protein
MVAVPLAFGRGPLSLTAAALFLLLHLRLSSKVVIAEKLILHDVQVAQQQFHQEQLQSSSSSSSTQLLSATIKTQLFSVSSTIKPNQRTLLANALHNFFEHVFDDARQDVYKLDITHVAIYEEKLLMKATTATDGDSHRKLVLNSLQSSQFHIQQARGGSGGGGGDDNEDDDDDEAGKEDDDDDGYDDEYYDDGSKFEKNNDDQKKKESREVGIATSSQPTNSVSDSSLDYVLSFATFISAEDSTQPQSSLSQEGEFQSMLIHVCHKFSNHLVEFVQSIDDDYFAHVTNAMVSGYEEDELREKEEEEGMITLESKIVSSSTGSGLNVASIVAILLGSAVLVFAVVRIRR